MAIRGVTQSMEEYAPQPGVPIRYPTNEKALHQPIITNSTRVGPRPVSHTVYSNHLLTSDGDGVPCVFGIRLYQ